MRAPTRAVVLMVATAVFSFTGGTAGFTDGGSPADKGADGGQTTTHEDRSR